MRVKANVDGKSREKHSYAINLQVGNESVCIGEGVTKSAAEFALHIIRTLQAHENLAKCPASMVDLGTVAEYRTSKGLPVKGDD